MDEITITCTAKEYASQIGVTPEYLRKRIVDAGIKSVGNTHVGIQIAKLYNLDDLKTIRFKYKEGAAKKVVTVEDTVEYRMPLSVRLVQRNIRVVMEKKGWDWLTAHKWYCDNVHEVPEKVDIYAYL
jgi:hypothetical protein